MALTLEGRPVCKRCLLADIDVDGLYKKVSELIELMPEDVKADEKLYNSRLEICGCFVELRAAARKNYCPSAYKYWTAE